MLRLASGRTIGALDVQREYLAVAGSSPVSSRWARVLDLLEAGREDELDGEVEWVAKRSLLRRYADTRGIGWDDRRLAQVDLAFHEITRDDDGTPRGLFRLLESRGAAVRITDPEAVARATERPPSDTRAVLRGRLIAAARAIGVRYSVDWTQFTAHDLPDDAGEQADREVRLPDPLAVADQAVDDLLAVLGSTTVRECLSPPPRPQPSPSALPPC